MTFLNPLGLVWFAAAVPIVIFYILKIRHRRVPVATIMFWQQIYQQRRPRTLLQRLRHLLSLLMQLLLLALLVLALGELEWGHFQPRRYVLVLDNSASMNATDVSPSRLQRAKKDAERLVHSLRWFDEMAIISAGTDPKIYSGVTGHRRTLRAALRSIPSTDGPTEVAAAVALARRLLAEHPKGELHLFSDGAFEASEQMVEDPDIWLYRIGGDVGNVGITRFAVRRSLVDPISYEIFIEVANLSDAAADCRLEFRLNEQVLDVVPLALGPEEVWTHVFENATAEGGVLNARIDREDALGSDNQVWAILPRRKMRPVCLVTKDNLFLQSVFEAMPMLKLRVVSEPPKQLADNEMLVLDRQVPQPLPDGPILVIEPRESSDLWEVGEPIQNPLVSNQTTESPLMAHVRLDNVYMPEARKITPLASATILAKSISDEPLYLAFHRPGQGRVAVLSVNLERGDLPLRTAFPIMMSNALEWLSAEGDRFRESVRTGAVVSIDHVAASGSTDTVALGPDGHPHVVDVQNDRLTFGPVDQCGVWTLTQRDTASPPSEGPAGAEDAIRIASNLANHRESDLRAGHEATVDATKPTASSGRRPLWFYLIVAAFTLTMVEWWAYQRRWIS